MVWMDLGKSNLIRILGLNEHINPSNKVYEF